MTRSAPAAQSGQRQNQDLHKSDFTPPQTNIKPKQWRNGKNRLLILEQIAKRWASKGLYQSPSRAMAALLGVPE